MGYGEEMVVWLLPSEVMKEFFPHQALAIMIITDLLSNACVRQQTRPF